MWIRSLIVILVSVFTVVECVCAQVEAPSKSLANQPSQDDVASKPDLQQRGKDLLKAKTVVFLGDDITHGGSYISLIEAMLLENFDETPKIINLGVPYETCSGLTEPAFPTKSRPQLADRLDRVLEQTKPDFVFACYGMSDGIYHPFDEKRFEAYKSGIRELVTKVHEFGAKLVLITSPPFDTYAMSKKEGRLLQADAEGFTYNKIYENYDEEVLAKYAAWLVELESEDSVYAVVDAYTVIKQFIANQRFEDPNFTFSPDGVHFHQAGHRVLAHTILHAFGFNQSLPQGKMFVALVRERLAHSHNSWLTHVGAEFPRMRKGLSFPELEKKLMPINERLQKYLDEYHKK